MKSKVFIAKTKLTTKEVLSKLMLDQFQLRTSLYPIILIHPRTGKSMFLSEYVNEIDEGSRFAIECSDKQLVFVSRVENSVAGQLFFATGKGQYKEKKDEQNKVSTKQ